MKFSASNGLFTAKERSIYFVFPSTQVIESRMAAVSISGYVPAATWLESTYCYGNPLKPLLSSGTVKSVDELLEKVGLKDASTFQITPYGFEQLARWITAISPVADSRRLPRVVH